MAKPVIMTIDDDMSVLNTIQHDLHSHHVQDYRLIPANQDKKKLEQRNELSRCFWLSAHI